jgi:hypothetical protein
MKRSVILSCIICVALLTSCERYQSCALDYSYIFIDGDSGRVVTITYLERPWDVELPKKNQVVTENVTLPFFKETTLVRWIGQGIPDEFLQIESENDSTTRGIIFDIRLKQENQVCGVVHVFYPENAEGIWEDCKNTTNDSIFNYLKKIQYPCYIEFSKTDTVKRVWLRDWNGE